MAQIEQSALAKSDLVDIWLYIAQENLEAADRFIDQIEQKFFLLASTPEAGVSRDKLAPGLRSFPVGDYLIFYKPTQDGIVIVRVLSGYRDIDKLFGQ
jgi:toxin ParE1/3/4